MKAIEVPSGVEGEELKSRGMKFLATNILRRITGANLADFPPWKWCCKWIKKFVQSSDAREYWKFTVIFLFKKELNSELNADVDQEFRISLISILPFHARYICFQFILEFVEFSSTKESQ